MKQAYAHEAVLILDGDDRAPGAAITTALCGELAHEPPCPLAAHHTAAARQDDEVRLRILFATPPDQVDDVRGLIDAALGAGVFPGPEGGTTSWRTLRSGSIPIPPEDREHARRLLR